MRCPICNTLMKLQQGIYGEFFFCPNQYLGCTQKTITKLKIVKPTKSKAKPKIRYSYAYGDNSWEQRSKGSPYEGTSCLCGRNDYRIGGGGYCEYCGYTNQFKS